MKAIKWHVKQLISLALAALCDVLVLAGGRGSGKTTTSWGLLLTCAQENAGSRQLVVRTTESALREPWAKFRDFLNTNAITYAANEAQGEIRIGDAVIAFLPCESLEQWERTFRGHEYQQILVQEFASFRTPAVPLKFLENCRASNGRKTLYILETNPGPLGWWVQAVILDQAPKVEGEIWRCAELGNLKVAVVTSTVEDNPSLNAQDYDASLRAASYGAEGSYLRERYGNFAAISGSLYNLRSAHALPTWTIPQSWQSYPWIEICAAADHGSVNPFAIAIAAKFKEAGLGCDGSWFPRGSYVLIGEAHSAQPPAYNRAIREMDVRGICDAYLEELARLNLQQIPYLFIDNQVTQRHGQDPLINEYMRHLQGRVKPISKGRIATGVRRVRELLMHAQLPVMTQRPHPLHGILPSAPAVQTGTFFARQLAGLYFTVDTPYIRHCVETLMQSPRNAEEPLASSAAHGHDALRYLLESTGSALTAGETPGAPKATSEFVRLDQVYGARHQLDLSAKQRRSERHQAAIGAFKDRNLNSTHPDLTTTTKISRS